MKSEFCDIVIPHYGSDEKLERCQKALEEYKAWIGNICVIDNNRENRGFTKAINNGLLSTDLMYVLLLNNDCYAYENAFEPLFDRMIESPDCGIVTPMCLDYKDRDKIVHAGGVTPIPGTHRGGSRSLGNCRYPTKLRWSSFPVVLLRRKMIKEIGLLDERFFNFASDADYSYTARSRGWSVWYEPRSVWLHEGGASSKPDQTQGRILTDDQRKFIDKWITGRSFVELNTEVYGEVTDNGKKMDSKGNKPQTQRGITEVLGNKERQEDSLQSPAQSFEEKRQARQESEVSVDA